MGGPGSRQACSWMQEIWTQVFVLVSWVLQQFTQFTGRSINLSFCLFNCHLISRTKRRSRWFESMALRTLKIMVQVHSKYKHLYFSNWEFYDSLINKKINIEIITFLKLDIWYFCYYHLWKGGSQYHFVKLQWGFNWSINCHIIFVFY